MKVLNIVSHFSKVHWFQSAVLIFLMIACLNTFALGTQNSTSLENFILYGLIGFAIIFIFYGILVINKSLQVIKGYGKELNWFGSLSKYLFKHRLLVSILYFGLILYGIYWALTFSL